MEVPEPKGVNIVVLGPKRVMVQKSAIQSMALFKKRGLEVVSVNTSEFSKLDGCITCMSVRIRELPKDSPLFEMYDDDMSEMVQSNNGSLGNVEYVHNDEDDTEEVKVEGPF